MKRGFSETGDERLHHFRMKRDQNATPASSSRDRKEQRTKKKDQNRTNTKRKRKKNMINFSKKNNKKKKKPKQNGNHDTRKTTQASHSTIQRATTKTLSRIRHDSSFGFFPLATKSTTCTVVLLKHFGQTTRSIRARDISAIGEGKPGGISRVLHSFAHDASRTWHSAPPTRYKSVPSP